MASTNKTANLGLNQWVASDAVAMEDFNADNQLIEAAFGKRLELELILDKVINKRAETISVDVSGLDLGSYFGIIMATPQIEDCQLFLNSSSSATGRISNYSIVFTFPLWDRERKAIFSVIRPGYNDTTFLEFKYSEIKTLNFTHDISTFTSAAKIKIWGLK